MPYDKEYYQKNKEKLNKKSRERYKENLEAERLRGRIKHQNNKEKYNKRSKIWRKNNKEKVNKKAKKYREKYPEKIKAHNMANNRLKHLKRPGFEFHHPDYSKPLLVEVLPIEVHKQLHAQNLNFVTR